MRYRFLAEAHRCPVWSEGAQEVTRSSLVGTSSTETVIVGGGLSGLWTAFWLTEYSPGVLVHIVEAERIGHGASGRNGGWLSSLLPVSLTDLSSSIGEDRTVAVQTTMFEAVNEVVDLCLRHSIDADVAHGGSVSLIRGPAHEIRAQADLEDYRRFGFATHIAHLDRRHTAERVRVDNESVFRPDCAVIHPRRLVEAMARLLEDRGVVIHENSRATSIGSGRVETPNGSLVANSVVDCREAYGARDSGRRVVPIQSSMIATEPLSPKIWERIGLFGREALSDYRRQIVYAQRTADDRLAFGGRGVGYTYGSRVRSSADFDDRVHSQLFESMVDLFPELRDTRITHRWGGPLGVPRDWTWTVDFDDHDRVGRMGGYVGDGVTSTYVAGRAMARLIMEGADDLALVGHRSPRWEPEPLRWIGINTANRLASMVDRQESAGRVGGVLSRVVDALIG